MPADAAAPPAARSHESSLTALHHLRQARSAQQREQRRGTAVILYGVLVVTALLGTPYLLAAADASRSAQGANGQGPFAEQLLQGLPVTLPAAMGTLLLLALRNAAWRGPVLVDLPTAFWALPQPILRRPLLMPRLAASAVFMVPAGALTGAVVGFLIAAGANGALPAGTAAGAWAGGATGLGSVLCGVLVEFHDDFVSRSGRRLFAFVWALSAGLVGLSALSFFRELPVWAEHFLLWSGPWGWAVQPLLAAAGGRAPGWALASGLLVCLLVYGVRKSGRAVELIPAAALRRRARVVTQVSASLFSLELRQAKFTVQRAHRLRSHPAVRLPAPRRRWLVVPWRDATGLLRAPGRLAWAIALAAAAVVLTAAMAELVLRLQVFCSLLALAAMYLAAAQLAEPARVDSDDMRRSVNLPYVPGSLALWHAAVPATVLAAGTGMGVVAVALAQAWHPGLLVLLLCVPTMVGAALVSAYRGSMPPHVAIGVETPFGNTAPLQMTAWYLRGPLGALLLTVPVLVLTADRGAWSAGGTVWLLVVGGVQLLWAWYAAKQQH